ncbi:ABC transporter ATP-binding protein/permease [[Clostridium] innocuum]|nr:ABC transporter ATP-binding protein/permease [[Clostridium] innocuum]
MIDKRLLKEMPETKPYIIKQVGMQWISLLCNIVFVALMAYVLDGVYKKTVTVQDLFLTTGGVIICIAVRAICVRKASIYSHEASCHVREHLRMRLFTKLLEMKNSYTKCAPTSELIQLSVEGIDQLEIYFGRYLPQFFYSMLAPVSLFLILVWMDVKSAVVLIVCVPLIPMSIIAVQKFAKRLLSKYWSSYTTLGDSFLENLQGLTTLKIYQADEWKQQEMNKEAENFRKITMKVLTMQLNSVSVMDLIAYGGAALGSIVAIISFQQGSLSLFQVICIVLLSSEFFIPLRLLGSFFHIAMNGIAASDKIFRILDQPVERVDKKQWKHDAMHIQLRDVSFSYDDERSILHHIYMQLKPGQFTAIVGESGSGKSTIAKLIAGLEKNYHGQLLIDGMQRNEIDDDAFYQSFLYVSHQPFIFKGSVRENLSIASENVTEADMIAALQKVQLYAFIVEQGGLDMELMEQGNNLSGGQKQRLSIARALLANRDVYIFDEAASNIDADSEDAIVSVIHKLAETKTVLMITHRLKSIADCDQIYVLDKGMCREHGTHEALLKMKGIYTRMYEKQQEQEAMEGGVNHG